MFKLLVRSIASVLALAFLFSCTPTQQSTAIQPDPDWLTGKLDNGLSYHIHQMQGQPVELRLLVHAGAYKESLQQYGYAHFLEHMAFNGSKHFTENEVVSLFEDAGLSFGDDLNAFTSFDVTSYQLSLPDEASMDKALLWFRDIGDGLTLDPEQIELEKGVVLGEIRWRTESIPAPHQISDILLQSTVLDGYEVLGSPDSINTLDHKQLRNFYQQWYVPNNSEIIIVGDIDPQNAEAKIKEYFSSWKPKDLSDKDEITLTHTTDMTPVFIQSPEGSLSSVELIHANGVAKANTVEDQLEQMTQYLAYDLINNRLDARIFETSAPISEHYSGTFNLQNIRYGYISAYFSEQDREKAQQFIASELASLISHGISETEFDTALAVYSNQLEDIDAIFRRETSYVRIEDKQESLILNEVFQSEEDYKMMLERFVQQADTHVINQKIRQMLLADKQKFFFSESGPMSDAEFDSFPEHEQQQVMLSTMSGTGQKIDVVQKDVSFPVPKEVGRITEYQDEGDNLHKWTLENGVEVWLKQMPEAETSTYVQYAGTGGKFALTADYNPALDIVIPLMSQTGLHTLNTIEFGRFLTKEKIYITPELNLTSQGLYLSSDNDSLSNAFAVLREAATNAKVDDVQFNAVKSKLVKDKTEYLKSADGRLHAQMQEKIYGANSPLTVTTPEGLEAVTDYQIQTIYQTLFRQGRGFKLIMVSALPPKEFEGYLRRYIANISYQSATPAQQYISIPAGEENITYASETAKSVKYISVYSAETKKPDTKALYVYSLLQSILDKRLTTLIREKNGLDYSPRMGTEIYDDSTYRELWFSVTLDKEDLDKAKDGLSELVTHASEGFTQSELDTAKKQLASDIATLQDKPVDALYTLKRYLLNGYNYQAYRNPEPFMQDIQLEDINEAFRELTSGDILRTEGVILPKS